MTPMPAESSMKSNALCAGTHWEAGRSRMTRITSMRRGLSRRSARGRWLYAPFRVRGLGKIRELHTAPAQTRRNNPWVLSNALQCFSLLDGDSCLRIDCRRHGPWRKRVAELSGRIGLTTKRAANTVSPPRKLVRVFV